MRQSCSHGGGRSPGSAHALRQRRGPTDIGERFADWRGCVWSDRIFAKISKGLSVSAHKERQDLAEA